MDMKKVSINLSYMLRHSTDPLYINLEGGWADVQTIINSIKEKYPEVNIDILEQIVADDTKGRYSFNETHDKIRANQGHSIPGVVIQMEEPDPPEFLYHGTATRFLDFILNEGIKPMSRQYVHISPDIETATQVGKRHGKPVILVIKAQELAAAGHKLYLSSNGVWLTDEVPPEFFTVKRFIEVLQ